MAKIIQLHIWLKDKKERWTEPEVLRQHTIDGKKAMLPAPGKRLVIEPESDSLTQMKIQIARTVIPFRSKIRSYYVVAVVEKSDGEVAFRTIIPMTVIV